ncbi:hypothetical protein J2T17_002186 [Paenibacillus mucilaginosus]
MQCYLALAGAGAGQEGLNVSERRSFEGAKAVRAEKISARFKLTIPINKIGEWDSSNLESVL